jgi:PTS system mannose-specific IIC component
MLPEWSAGTLAALLGWGTLVGLDLVSVPQGMLARPLVAGTMAGLLVGDLETGLRLGALIELFALDVMPVGASRYPDFGPPTVAVVAGAAGLPGSWHEMLGLWGALGLALAGVGAWSLVWLRQLNATAIRRAGAALLAGERTAPGRLQRGGLARDAGRSLGLTAIGLVAAAGLRAMPTLDLPTGAALTVVLVGAGIGAALHGAIRSAATTGRLQRLAVGLVFGAVIAGFA